MYSFLEEKENRRISFDFDSTLKTAMGRPNPPIVAAYKEHMSNGNDIIIVTSRQYSDESFQEIEQFLKEHGLKASDIIHTNGEFKAGYLVDNNVDLHYDDDEYEIAEIDKTDVQAENAYTQEAMQDFQEYQDSL